MDAHVDAWKQHIGQLWMTGQITQSAYCRALNIRNLRPIY